MRELTTEPVVEASYKSAIVARRGSTCAAWLEDARVSACRERVDRVAVAVGCTQPTNAVARPSSSEASTTYGLSEAVIESQSQNSKMSSGQKPQNLYLYLYDTTSNIV